MSTETLPADASETQGKPAAIPKRSKGKARLLTLDSLDRRCRAAKRATQLIDDIHSDLGGRDNLSEAAKQLAQRGALLGVYCESIESAWLRGERVEWLDYFSAVNAQKRVLQVIGLDRRARTITQRDDEMQQLWTEAVASLDDDAVQEAT
jgi:hypothetical protein